MKIFAAGLLIAATVTLGLTTASGGAAAAAHRTLGVVPHHGNAHRVTTPKKTAGFTCGSSCSSYETAINTFFTDVAAASVSAPTTNVYGVATQYCQGVATDPPTASCGVDGTPVAYSSTFGGAYVEGRPLPASWCSDKWLNFHADKYCLTDAQLQTEIEKAIAANSWPTGDPTALFFIFTPANVGVCMYPGNASNSNPCTTNVFCAYHSNTLSNIIYAVEPDDAQIPDGGCGTGHTPVGFGADATISTASHEQNEAITDPLGTGWYAADGSENGDLCAYNFGSRLGFTPNGQWYNQQINTHDYYLQQEYSNADGGCLQQPNGIVSPVRTGDGAGPLLYNGGSVMLTNTVYAIYWIPAVPANTVLPKIFGTVKVGKKLTATHGTWSNAPKYTYQWLRCSSAGVSCKAIAGATRAWYILVTADARHRLEVRVTATNAAGSRIATSAPTVAVHPAARHRARKK